MRRISVVVGNTRRIPATIALVLAIGVGGCSNRAENVETPDSAVAAESGEESGTRFAKTEHYDHTRNGARLILDYDAESDSFKGSVSNATEGTLERVRVEVHLSNGVELGPTTPTDLGPGESMPVTLAATSNGFESWSAHPEVGGSEGGEHSGEKGEHREEGERGEEGEGGEHDGEGEGEHS